MSEKDSPAAKLLALARNHFGDGFDSKETDVDTKFFTAAAYGRVANYKDAAGKKWSQDPANENYRGQERILQADRIEWLCTDSEASAIVSHKGIDVLGARIEGELDMRDIRFARSLGFWECAFQVQPMFTDASLNALYFNGTHCPGLMLHRLRLEGSLFLRNGFVAKAMVDICGASIGGVLDCTGSSFLNKGGTALGAEGITVAGDVFLRDKFSAEGEVNLIGGSIGGILDCTGGSFLNKGGTALDAGGITVAGDVFLSAQTERGSGNQAVNLRVEGRIDFRRANILGEFRFRNVENPKEASLDLRHARARVFWDEADSWPEAGNLLVRGFEYDTFSERATVDAELRKKWLGLDARESEDFSPQPYEHLANVLSKSGHRSEARVIRVEKEKLLAKQERQRRVEALKREKDPEVLELGHRLSLLGRRFLHFVRLGWDFFYGKLTGYGYRPWNVLPWSLLIIIAGAPLYEIGYSKDWITPTRVHSQVAPRENVLEGYSTFQGLAYSIDAFVPLVNIEQVEYWLPNADRDPQWEWGGYYVSWSGALLFFYYFQVASGWILTTLLVVGVTGMVQREE